jgi:hypothetical protein
VPDTTRFTEGDPPSPGPVFIFVGCLAAGVTDNSAIRSTSVIQDKIAFGSREMQKACGI